MPEDMGHLIGHGVLISNGEWKGRQRRTLMANKPIPLHTRHNERVKLLPHLQLVGFKECKGIANLPGEDSVKMFK